MYHDEDDLILHNAATNLTAIRRNAISETFADMYRRDVERALVRTCR